MTTNKVKKVTKYRAHTTHGGGHRKKRRGAGNRGGRGNAGSGKRGKAKKQSTPKLGRHGFTSIYKKKSIKKINLAQLNKLIENQKIQETEGIIDLTKLGYHKLLSQGNLSIKIKIKINSFSKKAQEKVNAAGGEIITNLSVPEEKIASEKKETPEE